MSKKKPYMNDDNLINEGFFDKIKAWLKKRPKIKDPKERKRIPLRLRFAVANLNSKVDKFEKALKKELGDDYPDMPRFEPMDFINNR
tara:strand:- start:214 stop:474 length:261 start_codon:yes stop_codon:yes gene_type:complete